MFNVTLIQPDGYIFSLALKEAAEYLCAMLRQCGYGAQFSTNQLRHGEHNVILCAHLLGEGDLPRIPRDSIIFNSEPLGRADQWHFASDTYSKVLAQFYVWDYADRNLARIEHARKDAIPFWYCRELVRTRTPARRSRSLLFYGAPTPRRRTVLSAIAAKGVEVKFMHGMYDAQRDAEMFDAVGGAQPAQGRRRYRVRADPLLLSADQPCPGHQRRGARRRDGRRIQGFDVLLRWDRFRRARSGVV
jgi:hypothetical protein